MILYFRGNSGSSLLSPFGLLGGSNWFGGGEVEREVIVEETTEEKNAIQCVNSCVTLCKIKEVLCLVSASISHLSSPLSTESLIYLTKALLLASARPKKSTPATDRVGIMCLDILANLAIVNQVNLKFYLLFFIAN